MVGARCACAASCGSPNTLLREAIPKIRTADRSLTHGRVALTAPHTPDWVLKSLVKEATIGAGLGLAAGMIWKFSVDSPTRKKITAFYK